MISNTNFFMVLEGADGTGKTVVAKRLAERIGATYYKSPSGPFAEIRSSIDDTVDPITRFYFYRAAIQYDSAIVSKLLETGPVVVDRYLDSTNMIHSIVDDRVVEHVNNSHLLIPDLVIVLTANREVCRCRLNKREKLKKQEQDEELQCKISNGFTALGYPVVDTSSTTVDEAVEAVLMLLPTGATIC